MLYDCVPSSVSSESAQHFVGVFGMSPEDQEIERLERQINTLRRKQIFDRVETPKAKYGIPRNNDTVTKANTKLAGEIAKEISNSPITKATTKPVDKEPVMDNSKQNMPEHPYSNIPEAHYVPPNTKNFGAPVEKIHKEKEAAYKTVVPAAEKQLVDNVFQQAVTGSRVVLMIEELLNISPEFRQRFRKESMPRRVSIKEMENERNVGMNVNSDANG